MDAAQKLLKNSAILTATALLLATVGLAQTLVVSPGTTVAIGGTGFNTASVASSAAGTTEITYTIGAPDYSADVAGTAHWLSVSGTVTTPSNLVFTASTAGLSAGPHAATVTLTPTAPTGLTAVVITVTFNGAGSGGGGGGSTTLTASLNPVNLSSSVTSTSDNITTTSVSPISMTLATSPGATWLTAFFNGSNTISASGGASITVIGNSFNLAPGAYSGTVTLTPSSGTVLNITVNFTVGSSGSNGSWTVTPSTIAWSFTTNSGIFPNQAFSVTTTSGSSSYNVNTTSSNNWLLAFLPSVPGTDATLLNAIAVGTQFGLKVGGQANALTQGQYTGTAIISDSGGTEQLRVNVTLTVNGGNSAGLSISPSPVTFSAAVNGAQQSQSVNVTSSAGGALSVTGNLPPGLTFTAPVNTTIAPGGTAAFSVFANPFGLAVGTFTGTLQVVVGSQSGTVNVSLAVGGGGGGSGTTGVAPTSLSFAYEFGTNVAFVARQKLVITGPAGAWSSSIFTIDGGTWLKLTPGNGGSLPNPAIDGDAPIVSIDPTGLSVGSYTGSITITAPGGTQAVTVSLIVVSGTVLLPTPGTLIFSAQTGQSNPIGQSVFFSGSDTALNPLSITAVANSPWITLVTGATFVSVQVDQKGLGSGVFSGSISVSQAGAANSPTTIPVVFVVNGGGSGGSGTLTFSQNSIAFSSVNGVTTPNSTVLSVSAPTSTSFVGTIAYTSGSGTWLNVSPLSGVTTSNLSVSANSSGLAAGTYGATISFNANGVVQTVGVTLTVSTSSGGNTGNVSVSPASLGFSAAFGSSPATQTITVNSASGVAGIPFTVQVSAGADWLSTSASANNTTQSVLTVSVNSNALQPGSYAGNLRILPNGGDTVNIPVSLTITSLPTVSATPTTLTFNFRAGAAAPAPQPIAVSGGGATLTFSVTPSSTGNWLLASPATGTTPGTVSVSVNPTGLSTGTYNGNVLVAGTGGAPGATTVSVTLTVTAPLPTISRVTSAASFATGSIAPGEIITLFADDSSIGPATPAFLTLDATGKVSTTIGGVQVLIGGFACPMIFANASQVSAVVPYEIKGIVNPTVLLKFLGQSSNGVSVNVSSTAPGLFTANSSGTGPGAIANSNGSTNAPANPAARGDIVVVYVTGEGETSPAGITGKVTTVAAPPQPLTPGPLLQPSVTIGGQPANFTFAGEAPGFVSGVMQLNVLVPTSIAAGDQPIVVTMGGNRSQQGVTVSVK
jgi:uncharacterized protein (TIGR03437 family)